jgi:hypothetical protein
MDYAYSPIQNINNIQRIIEPRKIIKPLYGKRIIKLNMNDIKILRIKKFSSF